MLTEPSCMLLCVVSVCADRYQMCVSLGNGGFCDCGDSEAWKSDPTCAVHKPPAEQCPAAASPEQTGKATLLFSAGQYTTHRLGRV